MPLTAVLPDAPSQPKFRRSYALLRMLASAG